MRKPISKDIQTSVLVHSRRRCSICFGLNRDTALKVGQIAHIDRKNTNNVEDNLIFLCFIHHDEYDSRASQRKGLTAGELKKFRSELYASIDKAFSVQVHFGEVTVPTDDPYAGQYTRLGVGDDSAELELTPIPDSPTGEPRYAITGFALWGANREYGPHMGSLAFIGEVVDGVIDVSLPKFRDERCHNVKISFRDDCLVVTEENWLGVYGMNVTFRGEYRKSVHPK
jgi:hypothetical protein